MEIKKMLFDYCVDYVGDSILFLEKEMDSLQRAANSETKGSAGDKHETSRAMAHLEKERVAKQLAEKLILQKVIAQLRPEREHNIAKLGSVIQTNNGIYYLAIPIGKVELGDDKYFIISPLSPIGRVLINTKKGDILEFNQNKIEVLAIY